MRGRGHPMLADVESAGGGRVGAPIWRALDVGQSCPNCGCASVEVQVHVKWAALRGGAGVGKYLGCPACPWAGVMRIVADGAANQTPETH